MKYGVKVILTYSVEPDNRKFYEESISRSPFEQERKEIMLQAAKSFLWRKDQKDMAT